MGGELILTKYILHTRQNRALIRTANNLTKSIDHSRKDLVLPKELISFLLS